MESGPPERAIAEVGLVEIVREGGRRTYGFTPSGGWFAGCEEASELYGCYYRHFAVCKNVN